MSSNFHYPIDLNEDQNNQPFFCSWGSHQSSSSLSSSSSSSLSYLPLFNSPQEHGGYNTYHGDHLHSQVPLEAKMLVSSGGSCDPFLPKKEPRIKLTIRKKEDRSDLNETKGESGSSPMTVKWMSSKMRLMKKMIMSKTPMNDQTNYEENIDRKNNMSPMSLTDHGTDQSLNDNGYGNNNGVIRVCTDCNTTKTPLWRSGPRGPKSLCNACGIRQRKARRAAMAAAAAAAAAASGGSDDAPAAPPPPPQQFKVKKKMQNKNKRSSSHSNGGDDHHQANKTKKCKIMADSPAQNQSKSSLSLSSSSSNKLCFDDLTIILSKSSAFQQVFPQDEREAAILLMALSYGMVHG